MESTPIQVTIAGTTLKLFASGGEDEVVSLASLVEDKLRQVNPKGRPLTTQMCLVVAMSLAHDVEELRKTSERDLQLQRTDSEQKLKDQQNRLAAVQSSMRDLLRRVVTRIDFALEEEDEDSDENATQSPEVE